MLNPDGKFRTPGDLELRILPPVTVNVTEVIVRTTRGDVIHFPLSMSQKLRAATLQQRQNFQIMSEGESILWADIDEELYVTRMYSATKDL